MLSERSGALPVVAYSTVLLVKGSSVTPPLLVLVTLNLAASAVLWQAARNRNFWPLRRRLAIGSALLLWAAWCTLAWDWHTAATCNHPVALRDRRPIACLGDSLTAAERPHGGYPENLGNLLALPVINFGQPGISSGEALEQLPALLAAKPQIVIIEIGGHDFLKGYSRAATKANLEKMIASVNGIGAEPVVMEIPRGFIRDPFCGLERELAREHDLQLIGDGAIRNLVLWSPFAPPGMWTKGPYLSNDGLHPNDRGMEWLARRVADALVSMYGGEVLKARSKMP